MASSATILVCDDDESQRFLVREALENDSLKVVEASDGLQGLNLAIANPPDLIVLDVQMPVLDGFEVCRRLREHAHLRFIPILIVTGLDDHASIERAFHLGATSFVVKPINWSILAHDVRYLLRNATIEHDLREAVGHLELTSRALQDKTTRLEVALAMASDAARAKSQFIATMSHELRTPLNAIIGFSDLLRQQKFGPVSEPRYRGYHEDIFNSGQHLLALVNDILDISSAIGGHMELREELIDIEEAVRQCADLVSPQADKAGLRVCFEISARRIELRADARRFRQILLNLLANAIKFTERGGEVKISAALVDRGLAVVVTDTGIGMTRVEMAKALELFGQVDSTLARKHEGAGLGLPLTLQLVKLHQGELTIESKPGSGTVVTVLFPVDRIAMPLAGSRIG